MEEFADGAVEKPGQELLRLIEKALDRYGSSVKTVLFFQLQKEYGLRREEIPSKLQTFVNGLEMFFGAGSHRVEDSIREELKQFTGIQNLESMNLVSALREVNHYLQR